MSPWFTTRSLEFTSVPFPAAASSPAENDDRRRATCGTRARLSLPESDWRWWLGLRRLRRAAAARPQRRGRLGSVSDERMRNAEQQAVGEAWLGPRGAARGVGLRRESAERGAHWGGGNGGSTAWRVRGKAHRRPLYRWTRARG
jgi:hypothetical protein